MKPYQEAEKQDRRRRRRERYIILSLAVLIILLTYLGRNVFDLGLDLPIPNSILIFALIDINVILLLLLLFLTTRNLVKLLFERKKGIMGAKLRTKLVMAFVSLSLLPTIILFFVSVQFISASIEYWFNLPIERSLKISLEVGQEYYDQVTDEILSYGNNLGRLITYHGYMLISRKEELKKFIAEKRLEYRLTAIKVYSMKMKLRAQAIDERINLGSFKDPGMDILREAFNSGSERHDFQSSTHGVLISGIVPVFSRTESKAVVGLVVLEKFIPRSFANRLDAIAKGLEEYKQFKMLKTPVKVTHMILLTIVTLLIIFSSIWFGFFLSKGIIVPIQELAEGTNRIASGDYDFYIDLESGDEIGILVNSFNRMTQDLKNSKQQLEEANAELVRSNIQLEQRRLYMEIVLANVAAGVISADAQGNILTINKSAERMLNIRANEIIGKNYRDVLPLDQFRIIEEFLTDKRLFRKGSVERQARITVGEKTLILLVSLNVLRDDQGRYLGLVAVFEDLTEIERAHRMAAWREVARRIAHEVKNPLTPIQLSAQRLKRRYGDKVGPEESKIFEECTSMIINQVEELKRLVNEFSSFARMPASHPTPNNLNSVIREAVGLYKDVQRDVTIRFTECPEVPEFKLDKEQMKRVMINLLDNALDAIDGGGEITVELAYEEEQGVVRLVVADNGRGISPEHKIRLFEPYFSTKRHGTGLGLTIINTIISDHGGSIRVQGNTPRGTRFIIELPVKT
ncbi:MAG: PAS domain-containing protein [Deltaproteobacteria bacterium]|nr:PAS domain-containing protein [Deltaproteobacteria bacterium]MBW2017035.1 PAS domain-containing protein [Deltaproteobacteria bacterium]MBW2302940.1 PAS domain-containing protein [Deltaproteobacteria bacterium]